MKGRTWNVLWLGVCIDIHVQALAASRRDNRDGKGLPDENVCIVGTEQSSINMTARSGECHQSFAPALSVCFTRHHVFLDIMPNLGALSSPDHPLIDQNVQQWYLCMRAALSPCTNGPVRFLPGQKTLEAIRCKLVAGPGRRSSNVSSSKEAFH